MWLQVKTSAHRNTKWFSAAAKLLAGNRHDHLHTVPQSADVVVVGGGVVGASTAFHLAQQGAGSGVVLLEADKLTCGTTWHSAAMLNTLRGNIIEAQLVNHTKYLASEVLEVRTFYSSLTDTSLFHCQKAVMNVKAGVWWNF